MTTTTIMIKKIDAILHPIVFEQIICIQVGTQSTNLITHNVCVCGGFIHSSASCPAHLIQYNIMLRTKEAMRTNNNNCPVIKTQRFRHTHRHSYVCWCWWEGRRKPFRMVLLSVTFSIFARFLFPSLYPSLSRSECLFPYFAFMFVTMFNKCYKSRCFAWFFSVIIIILLCPPHSLKVCWLFFKLVP